MRHKKLVFSVVITIVLVLYADMSLCRHTIFLYNAKIYVKMAELRDGSKKLFFSQRLLPLMINSNNIDYIILKDHYGGNEQIYVQNDSLLLFPIEYYTQLGNKDSYHYTDYKEVIFTIERFSAYESSKWLIINPDGSEETNVQWGSRLNPARFYDGHELKKNYSIIIYRRDWRGELLSGEPDGQNVHIWNLFRKPRKGSVPICVSKVDN